MSGNMKKFIYILLVFVLPLSASAQGATVEPVVTFSKDSADNAYSQERYADAIEAYEGLIAANGGSLDLHYNLGNAYYRFKEIGKAILNYERALKHDPTDANARFNLEVANKMMKDELPESEELFFAGWSDSVVNLFSITTWTLIGMLSFVLMLGCIFVYIFKSGTMRKVSLYVSLVSLSIVIVANLSALSLHNSMNDDTMAIVMKEEVILRSSPDLSGTELLKVHEGRKVKTLGNPVQGWVEVEVDNGNIVVGWVSADEIEKI